MTSNYALVLGGLDGSWHEPKRVDGGEGSSDGSDDKDEMARDNTAR
tara:strand:- start:808 stop:945 length:138 start_codon:yes stop_codon:yes gene_type:complete